MVRRVLVNGGLGNQMFQYAFYLSLKAKGLECCLDNSLFDYAKMHQGYELESVFGISETTCRQSPLHGFIVRVLYKYKPQRIVFCDKPYMYCQDAYTSNARYYSGCWIHPSYFAGIEDYVREAFQFKNVSEKNLDFLKDLATVNTVSLHIRRGDYLKNPIYGVCDENFHSSAINWINERVESPIFIVFSDDVEWCNEYLKQFNINYRMVDWNKGWDSYQDMFLMSQCKHNIIANSTFSWWGAWLNTNKNKIVVAPNRWTTNNQMDYSLPQWVFVEF